MAPNLPSDVAANLRLPGPGRLRQLVPSELQPEPVVLLQQLAPQPRLAVLPMELRQQEQPPARRGRRLAAANRPSDDAAHRDPESVPLVQRAGQARQLLRLSAQLARHLR